MADSKLTALSAISAVAAADLIYMVDDVAGTPTSTKATITQLLTFMDANITITESQISDLQAYITDVTGDNLSALADVTITANSDGEVLRWNGSAWINNTLAELGVSATGHTHTESDITDLQSYLVNIVEDLTPQLGADLEMQGFNLQSGGVIFLTEQAVPDAWVTGEGEIWVQSTTPNVLMFTDDAGTDFSVANTAMKLDSFAATSSAELAGVISDETGTGLLVFGTSPTLVTPALGTPSALVLTNATGLPVSGLANGTDGELITWDATGVATTVPVGTSGQVLTSNGAGAEPTFQAAGAADNLGDHTATEIIKSVTFGLQGEEAGHTIIATTASGAWTYSVPTADIHDFQVNSLSQMTVSETTIDFQANTLTDIADITSITNLNGVAIGDYALATGDTYTGAHLFNAGTMRIPLSATPTMAVDGDFAIDTTVTDFSHGVLKFYDGEEVGVVSMPIAQFTSPTDGNIVSYNATNDEFELVAAGAADNLGDHTATQDLIMGTFGIQFGDDAAAPAGTIPYITHLAAGNQYNTDASTIHDFLVNNVSQMTVSDSTIDFQANTLTDILDITSITSLNGVAIGDYALATGDTYTGAHLFNGATMRVPLSATPTMAVDGDFAIDTTVTDFSHGILKYYDGEEMAVVSMPIAQLTSPTDNHVVTYNATNDEFELQSAGAAGGDLTQYPVPCTLEIPQGTVAYPDIHSLATATAKVSGFVMPNGASPSTINFKCVCPTNLASTPAMKIRVRIMTLGAVGGPADVRLTVSTIGVADTEALDQTFTAETETTVTMPTATETMDYYVQDLTTDWAAGDTIIGKITRDPTDVADDFTDDIMIVGVDLLVDLTPA